MANLADPLSPGSRRGVSAPRSRPHPARLVVMALVLSIAAALAACTGADPETGSESRGNPGTTTTTIIEEAPGEPDLGTELEPVRALSGQLAVVDGEDLWVVPLSAMPWEQMAGGDGVMASQPVWAPDGSRLAWVGRRGAEIWIDVAAPGLDDQDDHDEADPGTSDDDQADPDQNRGMDDVVPQRPPVGRSPLTETPEYLAWDAEGSTLAYITPHGEGGVQELGVLVPGEDPASVVTAADIALAWNPESPSVALHLDGNRLARRLFDGSSAPLSELTHTTGQFTVPVWLDETRLLYVIDETLMVLNLELGVHTPVLDLGPVTRLVLGPDRTRLAYLTTRVGTRTVALEPDTPDGTDAPDADADADEVPVPEPGDLSLRVLDLVQGHDWLVTDETPLAFEWSPTGIHLSWLAETVPGAAQWHIWHPIGVVASLAEYEPTALEHRTYLPRFDQYAQSHRRWDPDGRAMVFAGTINGVSGVWVQLIEEDAGPQWLTEGDYATWSPVPSGGGGDAVSIL